MSNDTTTELRDYKGQKKRRKKLWEVDGYHCPIIGTCFSRVEIRKLAKKKVFNMSPGLSDHEIHSALVSLSQSRCEQSRYLQKLLESKYRKTILKFSKLKSEPDVKELWLQHFNNGAVAGAFWAVMTHPETSRDFAFDVHGEIHMIGHDFTSEYQKKIKHLEELKKHTSALEEVLGSERDEFKREKSQLEEEIANLRVISKEKELLDRENEKLRLHLDSMEAHIRNGVAEKQNQILKTRTIELQNENSSLAQRVAMLEEQLAEHTVLFDLAERTVEDIEESNTNLAHQKLEMEEEIKSLENVLLQKMGSGSDLFCSSCEDLGQVTCPGPQLCGKTVLYVGGQHKMVPRYRQLVEKYGGSFIHHDGGKEVARSILPKMLSQADAVLCPVDCVSHDACKCVKTMCKRHQKPCVMMRSSGLSSLARGLEQIVQ